MGSLRKRSRMEAELRKHSSQGFTMAELLIVVAIIAVLVAIAIPVFTTQLEKSREAVDLANVRSAYSVYKTYEMSGDAPDGGKWGDGTELYIYTTSGSFVRRNTPFPAPVDDACKLVSRSADFTDLVYTDFPGRDPDTGWKDYVIVVTHFFENNFNEWPNGEVFLLCPPALLGIP